MKQQNKSSSRRRRYAVTLIEMIIVMILIATITGALALNYQKSLDKGREFATRQRVERLRAILSLHFSQHPDEIGQNANWTAIIDASGLGPPQASSLLKDDWGKDFQISVDAPGGNLDIRIESPSTTRLNLK